jgi:hypothetical protein
MDDDALDALRPDEGHVRVEGEVTATIVITDLDPVRGGYRCRNWWESLPEDLIKSESGHAKFLCGSFDQEGQGILTYRHLESHSV